MKEKHFGIRMNGVSLPCPSDLRGRQSVRATFRLTENAIHAVSIISVNLGIKQKSLFEHLMEDTDVLDLIAKEIKVSEFKKCDRVQKTYVISRRTLSLLDQLSKSLGTPRDALVEYSIRRLLPLIDQEREKHEKRKEYLEEIRTHFQEGKRILGKMEKSLGEEDPLYLKMKSAVNQYAGLHEDMEAFIEKTRKIEEFES